jgi:hypothetical protein
MRSLGLSVLVASLLSHTTAFAQQSTADRQNAQVRSGTKKMWIGIGLIAVGAVLALPATADAGDSKDGLVLTSVGLFFAGGTLAWLGAEQRRKAVRPHTSVAVTLGRRTGVQIRTAW